MKLKIAANDRPARYGIALGLALHAVWRGLVGVFVPGDLPRDYAKRRVRGWHGSL